MFEFTLILRSIYERPLWYHQVWILASPPAVSRVFRFAVTSIGVTNGHCEHVHRENTVLLSRERVNKVTKTMTSLPLSPVDFFFFFFWFTLTREATLCQNILNAHRKSLESLNYSLLSWNQPKTKWSRKIFLQLGQSYIIKILVFRPFLFLFKLAKVVFKTFCDSFSQIAFRNTIVPLPKSQTCHPARSQASLHLPHILYWHDKKFTSSSPCSQFLLRLEVAQSPHENDMPGANTYQRRFSEILG